MGFGRKVRDLVDTVGVQGFCKQVGVEDIAVDEGEPGVLFEGFDVLAMACIGERIVTDDLMTRVERDLNEIASNKTGGPGDQDGFHAPDATRLRAVQVGGSGGLPCNQFDRKVWKSPSDLDQGFEHRVGRARAFEALVIVE